MANFTAGALLASISCGFKLRGHFLPQLNLGCPDTGGEAERRRAEVVVEEPALGGCGGG